MRYPIQFDADTKTLTICKPDDNSPDADAVSHLVYGEEGEIPTVINPPQPDQHLTNVALQQGIARENFDLVTVVNDSGNERLDKFVQQGDEEKAARLDELEQSKLVDGGDFNNDDNTGEHEVDEDPGHEGPKTKKVNDPKAKKEAKTDA